MNNYFIIIVIIIARVWFADIFLFEFKMPFM